MLAIHQQHLVMWVSKAAVRRHSLVLAALLRRLRPVEAAALGKVLLMVGLQFSAEGENIDGLERTSMVANALLPLAAGSAPLQGSLETHARA